MTDFDPAQAKRVFQLVVLTALSDGVTDGAEAVLVKEMRASEPLLAAVQDPRGAGLEARDRLEADGLEVAVRGVAVGILGRSYQEAAFRLCARVMGADGETDMEEAMLLGHLQELFSFTPYDVKRLLAG